MSKRVLIISVLLAGLLGGFQNFAPVPDSRQIREELGRIYLEDARSECEWLDAISQSLRAQPAGSELTGAVDMQSYVENIEKIEDAAGDVHLKGRSAGAKVGRVRNFSGNLVLCDMNLDALENAVGDVIVVRGSVNSIKNVTGNVIVYDGEVGDVVGGDGLIAWRAPNGVVRVEKMGEDLSSGL